MRVLYLAPHLSTGGMPAFLLKRIQTLLEYTDVDVYVVEFKNYSNEYNVQKKEINKITPIMTLGEDKMLLIDMIKNLKIDVVHIDEMIEGFDSHNQVPKELKDALYVNDRSWRIVETCHNIWFNPDRDKKYHPDAYAFCTPYHLQTFANMPSIKDVLEFPIEDKKNYSLIGKYRHELNFDVEYKHVVNVGLWTPGKNQAEAIELAKKMPDVMFHFIGNQAINFKEYWEPLMKDLPSNCVVWGERDDVYKFLIACDVFMFNSTWECNPLSIREAINYGCKIITRNLPQYCGMFDDYIMPLNNQLLENQTKTLLHDYIYYDIPKDECKKFAKGHERLYRYICSNTPHEQVPTIINHFVNGPFVEINSVTNSTYNIDILTPNGESYYKTDVSSNSWVRGMREYHTDWTIKIHENNELIYESKLDYVNKNVYIAFDSKSLGDTIAWMPYCLEFKNKHNCHVIVSTFRNELFKDVYPELEFVEPGTTVNNIAGMYKIGWFYNENMEPELPNTIPLQKAATNILGLEYKEIVPRISFTPGKKPYRKYITIATNSTAGCKFWTREAWQELINHLVKTGYKVVNVSLEDNPFDNCIVPEDKSMENTMNIIHHSKLFIGLSSGLSWLAWALKKDVVMISNFTKADHEFSCIRITNTNVCHGCWNKPEFKFDKGDWEWCPVNKNTPDQFICQKSISAQMVIDEIKKAGF
jgi:autotransporter strand-loop-strand O-heptosyltransferase